MTDILLWLIVIELTLGLILGGFVLYEIQTALAVIVLHDCQTADDPISVPPPLLQEAAAAVREPVVVDDRDTIGTFTGTAWN